MFSSTYHVFCIESTSRHSRRTYCALGALGTPRQVFPGPGEVASYTLFCVDGRAEAQGGERADYPGAVGHGPSRAAMAGHGEAAFGSELSLSPYQGLLRPTAACVAPSHRPLPHCAESLLRAGVSGQQAVSLDACNL